MTKRITRIAPKQLSKIFGCLYAFIGFILGLIFGITTFLSVFAGNTNGWWMGILALLGFTVGYGLMGVIAGFISAWLYNFVASKIGGVEFEVE